MEHFEKNTATNHMKKMPVARRGVFGIPPRVLLRMEMEAVQVL